MFLAKPGEYEATGLYSIGHLILLILTLIGIIIAKYLAEKKKLQKLSKM